MEFNTQPMIKKINNFQFSLNDQIGKGFSSKVYKGKHIINQTLAAIKMIDLTKNLNPIEKQLLANEVRALRTINNINVLKLYQIFQTENNLYIITELCEKDLAEYLKQKGPINETESLNILKQITKGFNALTDLKILHRDTKPSNIFLNQGSVKIADFGFCQFIQSRNPNMPFYNVGSPKYMSPQAYKKTHYSQKSDIWGVGLIFLEMLNGKLPFDGMQYDQMIKLIATGAAYKNLQISGFSKMLLSRMLSIDVQRRLDFKQLMKLLEGIPNLQKPKKMSILPMNKISSSQQVHYRSSLMTKMPSTTKAQKRIMAPKQNLQQITFKSKECIFVEGTIDHQPNCFPNPKKIQSQNYQKENQLRRHQKSYHQVQKQQIIDKNRRPISFTNHNSPNYFSSGPSGSPTNSKNPPFLKNNFEIKIAHQTPQNNSNKNVIQDGSNQLKIQNLIKIISNIHSDPTFRLNFNKIRVLKLLYSYAYKKIKKQLNKQYNKSAELVNLQIILSGYGFLEYESLNQQDPYFHYVFNNIDELPSSQSYPYLSFWISRCLKQYEQQFQKQWKFKDINEQNQDAIDLFTKTKLLFNLYLKLNPQKKINKNQIFSGKQLKYTIDMYNDVINGIKQIKV